MLSDVFRTKLVDCRRNKSTKKQKWFSHFKWDFSIDEKLRSDNYYAVLNSIWTVIWLLTSRNLTPFRWTTDLLKTCVPQTRAVASVMQWRQMPPLNFGPEVQYFDEFWKKDYMLFVFIVIQNGKVFFSVK